MKGNESYSSFYGRERGEQYFLFLLDRSCASDSSIGFFLVLDRCLIACSVEKKMYAKLSLEKSKSFLFLSILTYPAFLI